MEARSKHRNTKSISEKHPSGPSWHPFSRNWADFVKASMPVDHRTKQPAGLLHGGASEALAETLGSVASFLSLDDMEKSSVVGIEINANHLRPVKGGEVVGIVKPLKVGRRIHIWDINIFHKDQLICSSRLTVAVIHRNTKT